MNSEVHRRADKGEGPAEPAKVGFAGFVGSVDRRIYAIADDPYCLWEDDTKAAALAFLRSVDHEYFEYIVQRSIADLENPANGMRAATSMRLALFHGGETLFLLIGALIQAPLCPHAWIGQCSTGDLRIVLERIEAGGDLLMQNIRI
ncbi:hypothetical protein EJO68_33360 [Variovorax atrisoli]|nr:hypothetical protein EJO68_33360 [Variovorax sp. 369]